MKKTLSSLVVLLIAVAPAVALEWHTVGPRAMGMGGAGVAAVQGPIAAYWNPAALGRATANAYGVQIPFGVRAAVTGSVIEGANDLEALKDSQTPTQAQVDAALAKLNQPGNGVRVGVDAGLNTKIGKFALFLNSFLDMGAVPTVDMVNTAPAAIVAGTNNSKLTLKGAQVTEFGIGYGQEMGFAPGLYLGGNLKLMAAQVGYYDYFVLRNTNDDSNMLSKFKDGAEKSSNFGVDLGVLWDITRTFEGAVLHPRVGLTARNINNPKFKQPAAATAAGAVGKYAVNPQLRLGGSISPFNWWNITSDLDLTRNLTPVDNVASRQFGVGNEFNVFNRSWINIPLRVGLMRNLAESGSGTMLTAGAGLNFLHVMLEVSGALSPKSVATQSQGKSTKVPREAAAAIQLSVLFGGSDESGELQGATRVDDQPVSTEKVREEADKAEKALDKEAGKATDPTGAPKQP